MASLAACELKPQAPLDESPAQEAKPSAPSAEKQVPVRLVGVAEPQLKAMPIVRSKAAPSTPTAGGR